MKLTSIEQVKPGMQIFVSYGPVLRFTKTLWAQTSPFQTPGDVDSHWIIASDEENTSHSELNLLFDIRSLRDAGIEEPLHNDHATFTTLEEANLHAGILEE